MDGLAAFPVPKNFGNVLFIIGSLSLGQRPQLKNGFSDASKHTSDFKIDVIYRVFVSILLGWRAGLWVLRR
jgi:hypothetical protein